MSMRAKDWVEEQNRKERGGEGGDLMKGVLVTIAPAVGRMIRAFLIAFWEAKW